MLEELNKIHPRSYHEQVGDDNTMPYIVFTIPTTTPGTEDEVIIETRYWDDANTWNSVEDTKRLDELYDRVENHFNGNVFPSEGFSTRLYKLQGPRELPDPDPNLRRRELRFVAKTFFKKKG